MIKKITFLFLMVLFFGNNLSAEKQSLATDVQADFIFENACVFESVLFTDLSFGNVTNWSWDFNGVGTSNEQDPEFTFSGSGTFTVQLIVSNNLCSDTIVKEIQISNQIPSFQDTTVCNNEIVTFNDNSYSEFVGTPTVFTYTDTLVSSQGCDSLAVLRVTVNPCGCEINFPNIFTPNDDGVNDTFEPILVCDQIIRNYELIVYDRWGETVFETYDFNKPWDGKINGFPMPTDVFIIWVQYEIVDDANNKRSVKEVIDVTLIR